MYQIYFLSIATTITAGLSLSSDSLLERLRVGAILNTDVLRSSGFRIGVGLATFVVGFLKLLSVSPGDVAVVGDLIPALSGMLAGFALGFQFYRDRSSVETQALARISAIVDRFGGTLGAVSIGAGLAHFLLHSVLFL